VSFDLSARIRERFGLVEVHPSESQLRQLVQYCHLLERWNTRINLTAMPLSGFPDAVLDSLLTEPVAAAAHLRRTARRWLDFGSGGGSPAIPLKIWFPRVQLTMVEARAKKCSFLREAIRTLALPEASVWTGRIEELESVTVAVDLVTVRALKLDHTIVESAHSVLNTGGQFAVFGTQLTPEVGGGFLHDSSVPLPVPGHQLHLFSALK